MVEIENKLQKVYTCAVSASVEMVGGKWKTSILLQLRNRTMRFGELQRLVTISQKVLTQQLKELEADGLVRRQVYAEVPPRVEYSLSPYGQTLQPVLEALYTWGLQHYQRQLAVDPITACLSEEAPACSLAAQAVPNPA